MIRINLLGGERQKAKSAARFDASQQLTAMCGLVVVASVCGIGFWFWKLGHESTQLDAQISSLKREAARLDSVMAEVKTFEDRKATLQQRVALIERLRQGQTVPVQVLDHVSRSLPEMLWLTDLKEEGDFITIEGRTTTLIGLSDFVNNLGTNPVLQKPIEILDSAAEGGEARPGTGPELIKFTVRAGVNGRPPQEEAPKGGKEEGEAVMALKLDFGRLPWHAQLGIFVVLGLAGAGAFWYFYAAPAESKLVTKRAEVRKLQGEIKAGLATAKRLPEFRREVTILEAQLERLRAVLPEEQDVADLLRRVQAMATQSNLTIRGFTPAAITRREMHAEWPIGLRLEGSYHDLGTFLERVSKFPRIINVGTMHIAARTTQTPTATVTAECTAMTFVLVKDAPVEDAKGKKKGKAAKGKAAQVATPAAALGE